LMTTDTSIQKVNTNIGIDNLFKQKKRMFIIRFFLWIVDFRSNNNVLRAGDRNPVLRLWQVYGACLLLCGVSYFNLFFKSIRSCRILAISID
jgi:hypothetical protein